MFHTSIYILYIEHGLLKQTKALYLNWGTSSTRKLQKSIHHFDLGKSGTLRNLIKLCKQICFNKNEDFIWTSLLFEPRRIQSYNIELRELFNGDFIVKCLLFEPRKIQRNILEVRELCNEDIIEKYLLLELRRIQSYIREVRELFTTRRLDVIKRISP